MFNFLTTSKYIFWKLIIWGGEGRCGVSLQGNTYKTQIGRPVVTLPSRRI